MRRLLKKAKPFNKFSKIDRLIKKNVYLMSYKKNKTKDYHSLSYLINKEYKLSQSDCIKLGIAVEKVLSDIILEFNKDLVSIKTKNCKNKKEKDHLFLNKTTKQVFYSELKANLNLDTEKSIATYKKCLSIVKDLKKVYPGYTIHWCLLGLRYYERGLIEKKIISKYSTIHKNVYGMNEYLCMLDIDITYDETSYRQFMNKIVEQMTNDI